MLRETVEEGGGNRRGGKIAPLTPAPLRFEGVQVSRSGACLSLCCGHLSVSPVSPAALAAVFKIGGCHRSILYRLFKTTAAARRQHELRGPFLAAVVEGRGEAGIIINGADRIARYVIRPHSSFLPSFLPLRSYKMPHHQRGFAIRHWSASAWEVFIRNSPINRFADTTAQKV